MEYVSFELECTLLSEKTKQGFAIKQTKTIRLKVLSVVIHTLIVISSTVPGTILGQSMPNYFYQEYPGKTPKLFAPEQISKPDRHEFGSVFSRDGSEFYFAVDFDGRAEIHHSKLINGDWTIIDVLLSHSKYGFNDPMLSPDQQRLYFISNMPTATNPVKDDIDIWYIERIDAGWGKPINVGEPINSPNNEYYISFTSDSTMYFASNAHAADDQPYNYDIYASSKKDHWQIPTRLPDEINTSRYEADVFVSPDQSYLIFCAIRRDGLGQGDLYVSFHDGFGSWSKARNLDVLNDTLHQLCPFVTYDGKFIFYTSNQDIYWVDASVIEKYRE